MYTGIGVVGPQPTSLRFFFFFALSAFYVSALASVSSDWKQNSNAGLYVVSSFVISVLNFDDLLFAGIGDQCKNEGITKFTEVLSEMSGAEGHCMFVRSTLTPCLIPKSAIQQLLYSNANH